MSIAGHELIKKLEPYIVPIEIEDYGPARLEQIYIGISGDLIGLSSDASAGASQRSP
jgi:hypothetical protein